MFERSLPLALTLLALGTGCTLRQGKSFGGGGNAPALPHQPMVVLEQAPQPTRSFETSAAERTIRAPHVNVPREAPIGSRVREYQQCWRCR